MAFDWKKLVVAIDWERLPYNTQLFTGYPFKELGDPPGQRAPIREAWFRNYDGNKYVTVECGGQIVEVKSGYLFLTFDECYAFENQG